MKKQYLLRNRGLFTRRRLFLAVGTFVLVIVIVLLRIIAPGILVAVASPVWRAGTATTQGVHGLFSVFYSSSELIRARDAALNENLSLTNTNRMLSTQISDLTRLVGTRQESARRILAGVVARPPLSPYDTLTLDVGSTAGIREGVLVFGPGNVPLGTIILVTARSARVSLFSSPGTVTDGWVGEKRLPVTLTGVSAGAFSATLARDSGALVNDVVYIPGPGALPIGTIVQIDTDPSSPHDVVHIVPYTNIFSLTWVEVASQ